MAEMPKRYIRVDDPLWEAAKIKADREGTTLSILFRDWLTDYVQGVAPVPRHMVESELSVVLAHLHQLHNKLSHMTHARNGHAR